MQILMIFLDFQTPTCKTICSFVQTKQLSTADCGRFSKYYMMLYRSPWKLECLKLSKLRLPLDVRCLKIAKSHFSQKAGFLSKLFDHSLTNHICLAVDEKKSLLFIFFSRKLTVKWIQFVHNIWSYNQCIIKKISHLASLWGIRE